MKPFCQFTFRYFTSVVIFQVKLFYGMSSATAMEKHVGGVAEYRYTYISYTTFKYITQCSLWKRGADKDFIIIWESGVWSFCNLYNLIKKDSKEVLQDIFSRVLDRKKKNFTYKKNLLFKNYVNSKNYIS